MNNFDLVHRISTKTTFQVLQKIDLDAGSLQRLTFFYQPIIGSKAMALFITLVGKKNYQNYFQTSCFHKQLIILLMCGYDELNLLFKKLQATGLINTHKNESLKEPNYIYEILTVKDLNSFFNDPNLRNMFFSRVPEDWKRAYDVFFGSEESNTCKEISGFRNITISFTESFNFSGFKKEKKSSFFTPFQKQSKDDWKSIFSSSFKNQLPTKNTLLNTKEIKFLPDSWFKKEYLEKINFSSESYFSFLTNRRPSSSVSNIFSGLREMGLTQEVINCLITYVLWKNRQRLEESYIFKIAKTLVSRSINTDLEQTIFHFNNAFMYLKQRRNF